MSAENWSLLVVALALMVYLTWTLLHPERF